MPARWAASFRSKSASAGRARRQGLLASSREQLTFELRKLAARVFLLVAAALAQVLCCPASAGQPTPFTVRDSVEWTRILSAGAWRSAQPALFSPKRTQFLVYTRRGDIERNANVARILVFESKAVEAYLASSDAVPPRGQVLAEVFVRQDSNALMSITWIDDRRVGFLAEGVNGALQVFIADLAAGAAMQVTSTKNGVASFAIAGDTLLFYAYRDAPDHSLVQPVGDQSLSDLIGRPDATSGAMELFALSVSSGIARRIDLPAARLSAEYRTIWMSPSGRYVVVLGPALAAPSHWTAYRAGALESHYLNDAAAAHPDSVAASLAPKLRYLLVDLERSEVRPLLDAPSGSIARTFGPTAVYWREGERSVIVSHTYLPLDVADGLERTRRASGPAVAEVDLRSGVATAIAWEPEAGSLSGRDFTGLIRAVELDPGVGTLHVQRQAKSGAANHEYFRKVGGRWRQVDAPRNSGNAMRLGVEVRQSLGERPKLYASTSGTAKVLFDPNPNADKFAFGRTEVMSWTDDNRLSWRGGLVYPTGYVAGRKYPLVLQTHGFRPDRFLLDGPAEDVGTAFAAQALANAGFVVLQASESPGAVTTDAREARLVAQGWQAAIHELVDRGLVDPEKVGIVAFSRTCMHAIRFLADFPNTATAVTLADGAWWGYGNSLALTNFPKSIVDEVRATTGSEPDPHRLQEWFDAQPLYKLSDSRTAIRIEAIGPGSMAALWETFAILQNAAHPVDMIYFPEGSHNLMKPVERIGSQEGNVDWFRFWLNGEEDAEPRKTAQYERWRRLRSRQP
jgi:dipeptidyl aminopeptidase/acylaminoacyl peptidase